MKKLALVLLPVLAAAGATAFQVRYLQERRAAEAARAAAEARATAQEELRLPLPAFRLVDRQGEPFGSDELRGQVWIADFIFTRCPSFCPRLSVAMRGLQDELQGHPRFEELRLVSFSVDPEADTPAALRTYAGQYAAHETRWKFLTGERAELWTLIKEGFKLDVSEAAAGGAGGPIHHSDRFVLVDRAGSIRGYYPLLSGAEERTRLLADLERLLAEPGP